MHHHTHTPEPSKIVQTADGRLVLASNHQPDTPPDGS